MSNPLLGSRISLISKKNIRYEGILYSINEQDATVALKDVKSFGTEGRELLDTTGGSSFVPPNDVVHAFLLFRGQDIKDLHVHEKTNEAAASQTEEETATKLQAEPTLVDEKPEPLDEEETQAKEKLDKEDTKTQQSKKAESKPPKKKGSEKAPNQKNGSKSKDSETKENNKPASQKKGGQRGKGNKNMVGTGASLLNRKARGAKGDQGPKVEGDFDFESNLAEFDKATIADDQDEMAKVSNTEIVNDNVEDDDGFDDFFDTISSDATDRANGINNRLYGAAERNLNLDTFGATSLGNSNRRRYYGRGRGGRGRGRSRRGKGGRGHSRSREGPGGGGGYNGASNNRSLQDTVPAPPKNNRWN